MFEEAWKGYNTIPGLGNVLLVLDFSCSAKWPPSGLSPQVWQQYHYILPQVFSDPNVHRSTSFRGLAPRDWFSESEVGAKNLHLDEPPKWSWRNGPDTKPRRSADAAKGPSKRSFLVIDRATLHCHYGLVLLEVGKTKKEGKWRRDREMSYVGFLRGRGWGWDRNPCAVISKGGLSGERGRGKPVRRREGTDQGGVPLQSSSSEIPQGSSERESPHRVGPPLRPGVSTSYALLWGAFFP